MKVLQLGKFYPIKGGVEKVMYSLATGLSEIGVDCDLLMASLDGDTDMITLNEHCVLYRVYTILEAKATMLSLQMISFLRKKGKEYDIIHVHHPDPMACLALKMSGYKGKVVLHWHSDILKQKILLKMFMPLQSWLVKRSDLIIGTSPIYLKESPYLQKVQEKTVCLPIGIKGKTANHEDVKQLRHRYAGKKIIFAMGRLVTYKGFRYLIDAARYLSSKYIILIGGDGPLRETLQTQIDVYELNNKVELLGYISKENLSAYYGAASLFCLSSIERTEAFAIVQSEAMSCGKPVVATKIKGSGVSWVNKDGYSGINVPPKDSKALAKAIDSICSDPDIYRGFCERAKERFEKMFKKEDMINNCLKIYNSLYE